MVATLKLYGWLSQNDGCLADFGNFATLATLSLLLQLRYSLLRLLLLWCQLLAGTRSGDAFANYVINFATSIFTCKT